MQNNQLNKKERKDETHEIGTYLVLQVVECPDCKPEADCLTCNGTGLTEQKVTLKQAASELWEDSFDYLEKE